MPYRRHHKPKVHIHPPQIHQPGHGWGWVLFFLILAIAGAGGWKLYELGGKRAGFDRQKAVARADAIASQMDAITAERNELRQKVAALEISSQVDKEAVVHLREELKNLQDENLALREEMKFLEGLVSDTSVSGALRIDDFSLSAGNAPNSFVYEISVSLTPASVKETKVQLSLKVLGRQGEKKAEVPLAVVDPKQRKRIDLTFKNLERFTGELALPEDFQPEEIEVELSVKGGTVRGEKKIYPWQPGSTG